MENIVVNTDISNEIAKLGLFGDSIFQFACNNATGLIPALQDRYQRKFDVINRGMSGYTTRWYLKYIDSILSGFSTGPYSTAVLFLGTNDCCEPGSGQHVPLEEFEQNLELLVTKLETKFSNVILVTPGAIDEGGTAPGCKIRRLDTIRKYVHVVNKVAAGRNLRSLDLLQVLSSKGDYRSLLHDGIHFTTEAYMLFYKHLIELLPHPDELPTFLPLWRDLI